MSTRAVIALYTPEDKRFVQVSCDGSLDVTGRRLLNYDSLDKVKALLDLGDLFALYPEIENCKTLQANLASWGEPDEPHPATPFTGLDDENLLGYLGSYNYAYCYIDGHPTLASGWWAICMEYDDDFDLENPSFDPWSPLPELISA